MTMLPQEIETLIIGGGLSGLTAAASLKRAGRAFHLIEAADAVGGRVRTDLVDGYRLDRGFQVLLTSYPTAQKFLDYESLNLRRFEPGAWIRYRDDWHLLSDPWRRPRSAWATLTNPAGSLIDKMRIALVRRRACQGELADVYRRPVGSTRDYLRDCGFSPRFVEAFFEPFLGGVFLDPTLGTSRRMFDFVFRMFAAGDAAVPAFGMQAIPDQLAASIGAKQISLQTTALSIDGDTVKLSDGQMIRAQNIVMATPASATAAIIGQEEPSDANPNWRQTYNLYYSVPVGAGRVARLADAKTLLLRGDETDGVIQTATVVSGVAEDYANEAAGGSRKTGKRHLVSVTLPVTSGQDVIEFDLQQTQASSSEQLANWLGCDRDDLEFIRAYPIRYGLPANDFDPVEKPIEYRQSAGGQSDEPSPGARIYVAGDHLSTPSIEGAMSTGQRVAEAIVSGESNFARSSICL